MSELGGDAQPMDDAALEALKANGYLAIRQQSVGAMDALAALNPDGLRAGIAYLDEKLEAAPNAETRAAMELDKMRLEYLILICGLRDEYQQKGNAKVEAFQALHVAPANGPAGFPFGKPGGRRAG
jgi:hypothetical protein